ncbi:O-antigen ligase domain-containing protein, partial [bacterium]
MTAKPILHLLVIYCFICWLLTRETGVSFPIGILIEVLLFIIILVAIVTVPKESWKNLNTDLFYLFLFWFLLSLFEVFNPYGASTIGWLKEIRSAAEYPLLIVLVSSVVFTAKKDLDVFLTIVIALSTLAALNGIKQLHIGLSRGDQVFLQYGGAATHLLWGRLRVFSFYTEAAQFGASQAHISLMALILALGPVKKKTKIVLLVCSALMFYGMLISGTRGALFALVPGAFVAILLSKKFKILISGGALAVLFLCFLKFTTIGNGNYQIYRFRSALDPNDPSLNVRLSSQRILKDYMEKIPFGGGLGVIGSN